VRKEGCSEGGRPCKERLSALLRKYRALLALRERRDALEAAGGEWTDVEGAARRAAFRRVAAEFPGALRELELPAAVLARRAGDIAEELAGGEGRAWVPVAIAFHERLAALLAAKLWLARRLGAGRALTDAVVEEMRGEIGWSGSRADAEAVRRPPGGRIVELVWAELEARFGRSRAELVDLLFASAE
jgi:hypothetical protein